MVEAHRASAPERNWAAAGPETGNDAYRNQTLRYVPVELGFSESVSLRTLLALWLRAMLPAFLIWMLFFIICLIGITTRSGFGPPSLLVGTLIATAVFWCVILLTRLNEPIAEWNTVLEDRAPAAASSYATIYGALAARRIPLQVNARRIRSALLAPKVVNNRLVLADGNYLAYVSVFEYGTSLYVGWTMWRRRRGSQLIVMFGKDVIGSLLGFTGIVNDMLRTEKPRAMREALHSAVREGVEVAVAGTEVPIASTFGGELPVEEHSPAAPTPAAQPPAPAG